MSDIIKSICRDRAQWAFLSLSACVTFSVFIRVYVKGGDKVEKDLLEQVYMKYMKPVYLYLFSLCHSRETAEDLTQERFLKALCSLEQAELVLPWLLKVARNLYIDLWRRDRRFDAMEEMAMTDEAEEVLELLIQKEQNRRLYEMILRLGRREREAVVLYYFAGLSQEEISRQLGTGHGNTRVILHRSKRKLKKMLEETDGRRADETDSERRCGR